MFEHLKIYGDINYRLRYMKLESLHKNGVKDDQSLDVATFSSMHLTTIYILMVHIVKLIEIYKKQGMLVRSN